MRKKLFYIVFFAIFLWIVSSTGQTMASTKLSGIENFPDSYKPYLYELKRKYPNWEFTALYTGIDWNTAISNEYANNKNLVPISYSDSWKCLISGLYNVEVDSGWVNSSRQAIEYVMDPRNFLNEVRIFQFEKLTYDENINTESGVEKVLYGTEFYNRLVSYKDSKGNSINTNSKYSSLILNAGIYSGVSPYHLAARIKQEVGPFLSHKSISGTVDGYEGLYNFYNIGATSSTEPLGAIKNGLMYAKNGKNGLSESELENQLIPWDNPEKAIKGGAVFIGKSYILVGQNCLYLQKFDVNNDRSSSLFWHQYMTNCLAPYNEAKSIYNGYSSSNMLNSSIGFIIPVYENMPSQPVNNPNIDANDFIYDNTPCYAKVSTTLNVRNGPGTSYEVLTSIPAKQKFVRIEHGIQNGERWDKVLLDNGIIGYVFQTYVAEVAIPEVRSIKLNANNTTMNIGDEMQINIQVEPSDAIGEVVWSSSDSNIVKVDDGKVTALSGGRATINARVGNVYDTLELLVYIPVRDINIDINNIQLIKGDTMKLTATIMPEDATNRQLVWSSDDVKIASVDENGVIKAISEGETFINVKASNEDVYKKCNVKVVKMDEDMYFELDNSLTMNGDEISGVNVNSVGEFKKLINTNLKIEFYDSKGNLLDDDSSIGTGYRLCLRDNDGNEVYNYYFIIYGDVNGDGTINSLDVLVLQRYILEMRDLDELYLKAGNISKNGNLPSSLDVLKIQKHILEVKMIEQ